MVGPFSLQNGPDFLLFLRSFIHSFNTFSQYSPHTRHGTKCFTRPEREKACTVTHGCTFSPLKCPSPPFTVSQKFGGRHRSQDACTHKTQSRGHSADGDRIHRSMTATHKTLVSVCILPLLPMCPHPRTPLLCFPTRSHSPDSTSEFTRRDCPAGVQSEPHTFTKSKSAFPSCRTSNGMPPLGP